MYRDLKGMTLVLALTLAPMAPALKAHPPDHNSEVSEKQIAFQNGYRDGFDHGQFDRSRGNTYDFHNREFKRADRGYNRELGEHDDYQKAFRNGYRQGYNDGYNGREPQQSYGPEGYYNSQPPYGENEAYNQNDQEDYGPAGHGYSQGDIAFQIGFRDGQQAGENDLSHNKRFRPTKADNYEDASHGYRKSYGSKQVYKDHYRQGFLRGYEQVFPRQY